MKNSWLIGVLIVGVVIAVFVFFNQQGEKETILLSDLFEETDKAATPNVEYEFINKDSQATKTLEPQKIPAPVVTAPKIEPQQAATEVSAKVEEAVSNSQNIFTVQIASFKDRPKAEKILEEVKKIESNAYIVTKNLGEKGTWYRLYAGKFSTKAEAQDLHNKLKDKFPNSFIMVSKQ